MCPLCQSLRVRKKGYYRKQTTRTQWVQRYFCNDCRRSYSSQTGRLSYREKKPHENQKIFRLICSGVSQARIAAILDIQRKTVARKIVKLACFARRDHQDWTKAQFICEEVQFDELETFEHSKCKPISVGIAVNGKTREIIGAYSASMPSKGRLAAISRKKYGPRRDMRLHAMRQLMERIRTTYAHVPQIKSDMKPSYRPLVAKYFPNSLHTTTKGRRGRIAGLGELKEGGFDPIFSLNHSYAMFRDNLKTLSRRTWCTAKKLCRLQDLLDLYIIFHNLFAVRKIRSPTICGDPIKYTSCKNIEADRTLHSEKTALSAHPSVKSH